MTMTCLGKNVRLREWILSKKKKNLNILQCYCPEIHDEFYER